MPTTDLVQFITDQLDQLPESQQRDIVNYLTTHYHLRGSDPFYYATSFARRPDIPPHFPIRQRDPAR